MCFLGDELGRCRSSPFDPHSDYICLQALQLVKRAAAQCALLLQCLEGWRAEFLALRRAAWSIMNTLSRKRRVAGGVSQGTQVGGVNELLQLF